MKRIFIDPDKCTGCKNCSVACMQSHRETGSVYDMGLADTSLEARNTILLDGKKAYKPLFCRHCEKPDCVASCQSGAMTKDPKTGHVSYDKEVCAQCFMCVMNCPFGVLKADRKTSSYVVRCDFCAAHDGDPQCVKMCPTKAIYVQEVDK
jgi:carbon-monoxide dehydrogenase iron sulfur subunit